MEDIVLAVEGLGKRYPGFELSDVTFSLARGEVVGLVGPNGAGKTTTIRIILGLAAVDAGKVELFGADPRHDRRALEKVAFVLDECGYYGSASCFDNGRLLADAYRSWSDARFRSLLSDFGIDAKKKIDDLSNGQRMKFSLAAALAHEAELLILDEPTSGLDPVSRSEILDLLYAYIADGRRTILFSTHITADLERIADRVAFLRSGRLVFYEETDELLRRYAIVKGPLSLLSAAKPLLEGLRESTAGFEGLGKRSRDLESIPGLVFEKPNLDEIVVYGSREDYRVQLVP